MNSQRTSKSRASVAGEAVVTYATGQTWGPRLRIRGTLAEPELAWLEEREIKGRGRSCRAAGARLAAAGALGLVGGAAALAGPSQRSAGPELPCSLSAAFLNRATDRADSCLRVCPGARASFFPRPLFRSGTCNSSRDGCRGNCPGARGMRGIPCPGASDHRGGRGSGRGTCMVPLWLHHTWG